jgi:hypothetical protein
LECRWQNQGKPGESFCRASGFSKGHE